MGLYKSTFVVALAGLLATACVPLPPRPYRAAYVTRATAEDCAVIVEVAKAMVGPNAKGMPIRPEHQTADGGEYQENCAWKKLGVMAPTDPRPREQSFVIYKPSYAPSGDSAQVTVDIIGPPQKGGRPPIAGYASCQLKRNGEAWAVQRCSRSAS